jgi:hypothetical protein
MKSGYRLLLSVCYRLQAGCSKYGFRAYRTISPILSLSHHISSVSCLTQIFQPSMASQGKPVRALPAGKYVLRTSSASKGPESQPLVAPCLPLQGPLRLPSPRPPARPLSSRSPAPLPPSCPAVEAPSPSPLPRPPARPSSSYPAAAPRRLPCCCRPSPPPPATLSSMRPRPNGLLLAPYPSQTARKRLRAKARGRRALEEGDAGGKVGQVGGEVRLQARLRGNSAATSAATSASTSAARRKPRQSLEEEALQVLHHPGLRKPERNIKLYAAP